MSEMSLASDRQHFLSYGNWEGVCDNYECVSKNNRDIVIDFDKNGVVRAYVPITSKKAEAIIGDLKIKLSDGSTFEDFKRFPANNKLRIYIPPEMQKKFIASKKFTVVDVGDFDIRNFAGVFEQGAFVLGINE
jgi:hypothetical protein